MRWSGQGKKVIFSFRPFLNMCIYFFMSFPLPQYLKNIVLGWRAEGFRLAINGYWLVYRQKPRLKVIGQTLSVCGTKIENQASSPVVAQSLSCVHLFLAPLTATCQGSLSFNISWSLLKLMSIGVNDIIQPSHPLVLHSPPAHNLSQHQCLFQWVGSLHQVSKVLELQHRSFQWIFRVDFL